MCPVYFILLRILRIGISWPERYIPRSTRQTSVDEEYISYPLQNKKNKSFSGSHRRQVKTEKKKITRGRDSERGSRQQKRKSESLPQGYHKAWGYPCRINALVTGTLFCLRTFLFCLRGEEDNGRERLERGRRTRESEAVFSSNRANSWWKTNKQALDVVQYARWRRATNKQAVNQTEEV